MERVTIEVVERKNPGKQCARSVRRDGSVPAIVYGQDINMPITVSHEGIKTLKSVHFSESAIVDMKINNSGSAKAIPVMMKDIQFHPLKDTVIHIDFLNNNMAFLLYIFAGKTRIE